MFFSEFKEELAKRPRVLLFTSLTLAHHGFVQNYNY